MSSEPSTITLTRDGGVSVLKLNRPTALNAWDAQLAGELCAAVDELSNDADVRAVLITGEGRAFSAGADIRKGFPPSQEAYWDIHTRLVRVHHPIITGIREMPKPVVGAINGMAAGIGCSLALACDLVVAARSASFLLAFINLGLAPDGGASAFVPARVGLSRATEMTFLGEPVPAETALAWGMINRVVADEKLAAETLALAHRLADGPTLAYAAAKRDLNAFVYAQLSAQLALEADEQQALAATADHAEGVRAFQAKRPARFEGR
jgi:2-(1,2-epoxy-1,2-dihydrophenyl)acetyl-CoA isomerase